VTPVFASQGVGELGSLILDSAEYGIVLLPGPGSSETVFLLSSSLPSPSLPSPGCNLPLIAFLV